MQNFWLFARIGLVFLRAKGSLPNLHVVSDSRIVNLSSCQYQHSESLRANHSDGLSDLFPFVVEGCVTCRAHGPTCRGQISSSCHDG